MQKYKYIHIFPNEKFISTFIEKLDFYFNIEEHYFIYLEGKNVRELPIESRENNLIISSLKEFLIKKKIIYEKFRVSDKIFIHGLYKWYFILFLNFKKDILFKSYWIIWGSDLYQYQNKSISGQIKTYFRKRIIQKVGSFVTYVYGDYNLAQKWYNAKGIYHECFIYPSNLYKEYNIKPKEHSTINLQIGNSADPSNNHIEVLKQLMKYKDENIQLLTPLSYGDKEYTKDIIENGKEFFEDNFIPLTELMPFQKYLEFLSKIDIAIFGHKRQQAMGNIITLLGLGKKVYMRRDITSWQLFQNIGVKVFDVENIDLELIDEHTKRDNQQKIKKYFSEKSYICQLKKIFEY
jgi:dTDP-N-acetylfucosamine:lipid II N-acetylfucosaminyltransferase